MATAASSGVLKICFFTERKVTTCQDLLVLVLVPLCGCELYMNAACVTAWLPPNTQRRSATGGECCRRDLVALAAAQLAVGARAGRFHWPLPLKVFRYDAQKASSVP